MIVPTRRLSPLQARCALTRSMICLRQTDAQHRRQPIRLANGTVVFRVVRLDQRQQCLPRYHLLHLDQEGLPPCALALALAVTERQLRMSSQSRCAIAAEVWGVVGRLLKFESIAAEFSSLRLADRRLRLWIRYAIRSSPAQSPALGARCPSGLSCYGPCSNQLRQSHQIARCHRQLEQRFDRFDCKSDVAHQPTAVLHQHMS